MPISDHVISSLVNYEKLRLWRENGIVDPNKPSGSGIGLGPEMYYPALEAQKYHFDKISGEVQKVFNAIADKTGRKYSIMEYSGAADAETVMVIMGCSALTAEAVVEKMNEKVGVINIRLWKPFDAKFFAQLIPNTCKNIAVMDRARDFTSTGE